jgi:hypothetical protein
MSKYGNRKAAASDGKVFSSKKECARYEELLLLQRMGKIHYLETQGRWALVPSQPGERRIDYIADFQYIDEAGKLHVEDTKGFRTKDYVIKRKLMLWLHHIKIEEI